MRTGPGENNREIILVHGLWFGAWSLLPLARRLERSGMPVRRFRYRSTRGDLDEHARQLYRFAGRSDCIERHFVGHSLGGLVILRMLDRFEGIASGRVVLMGSPLQGSRVAEKAGKLPGASVLLGSMRRTLESGYQPAAVRPETGMIAGDRPVGLGRLVGGLGGPGDGTVALDETQADWLTGHCVLPVTHTGMIYSAQAAELAVRFLQSGAFEPVRP